jgi:ubiquinone/menaquinone biosynthesis C-methylase UbiE
MVISKLVEVIPEPIKTLFKTFGFGRFLNFVYNKYDAELLSQREWVKEFKENRSKVLKYWKKYRYLDDINAICNITEDTKVLDVGCGVSTVLHYIKGKRFGIDPLADEYSKLYKYPEGMNIKKGFGENITFPDEKFDVVFCTNVLDHVTDPKKTVDEIYRVLKASGYFVLTLETFREKITRGLAHPHSFIKRDVYSLLEGRFEMRFEKETPRIGLRAYVNNSRRSHDKGLIMILEKA